MPRVKKNYGECCVCHIDVCGYDQKSSSKLYVAHKECAKTNRPRKNNAAAAAAAAEPDMCTDTCSICLDECTSQNGVKTPCGHGFHAKCLNMWKKSGRANANTCPCCRTLMTVPSRTNPRRTRAPRTRDPRTRAPPSNDFRLVVIDGLEYVYDGNVFVTQILRFEGDDNAYAVVDDHIRVVMFSDT